jgi:hypothetical protein
VLCWTAPCCCVCISPAGRNSERILFFFSFFARVDGCCVCKTQ